MDDDLIRQEKMDTIVRALQAWDDDRDPDWRQRDFPEIVWWRGTDGVLWTCCTNNLPCEHHEIPPAPWLERPHVFALSTGEWHCRQCDLAIRGNVRQSILPCPNYPTK